MFDKLKSIFIVNDEKENKKAAKTAEENMTEAEKLEEAAPVIDAKDITIDVKNTTPPPSGKPNQKFVDILLKAVEKSNLDGFDYLEFKSSLQSLSGMEMDDNTRYKSAMAMAKTMGATPEKLVSTAQHYLKTLNEEKSKFQTALKGQKAKQVTGKEKSITDTAKLIEQKKKQIEVLKKEIEVSTKKMEAMKAEINQSVTKVQSTSDNFHYAYKIVTGQILSDVENIKKHLLK